MEHPPIRKITTSYGNLLLRSFGDYVGIETETAERFVINRIPYKVNSSYELDEGVWRITRHVLSPIQRTDRNQFGSEPTISAVRKFREIMDLIIPPYMEGNAQFVLEGKEWSFQSQVKGLDLELARLEELHRSKSVERGEAQRKLYRVREQLAQIRSMTRDEVTDLQEGTDQVPGV